MPLGMDMRRVRRKSLYGAARARCVATRGHPARAGLTRPQRRPTPSCAVAFGADHANPLRHHPVGCTIQPIEDPGFAIIQNIPELPLAPSLTAMRLGIEKLNFLAMSCARHASPITRPFGAG